MRWSKAWRDIAYTNQNFITKYGFFVNEKEFKVIKAIPSGIIILTKFSDVNFL